MATAAFANTNTTKAKIASIASFERFLTANCATLAAVDTLVANDKTGSVLHQTFDRYGLHLVTSEGARGKKLARATVIQYLGLVKNWFFDKHPELTPLLTKRMSDVYSSLDTYFKAAPGASPSRQAPACTKGDLAALVDIWRTADSEVDFHDGALVILMWHVLGRSSDMTQLSKQNVVIHPGGAFSIRFGRVKTGVEQGVSLFWSKDFRTRPLHAIALMTAMDRVPCELVFRHLPRWETTDVATIVQDVVPLLSILQRHIEEVAVASGRPDVLLQLLMLLLFHYPKVVKVNGTGRYRAHMISAVANAGYTEYELLAWSMTLHHAQLECAKPKTSVVEEAQASSVSPEKSVRGILNEQVDLLKVLVEQNKDLRQRLELVEHELATLKTGVPPPQVAQSQATCGENAQSAETVSIDIYGEGEVQDVRTPKRRKAAKKSLADVWTEWFTSNPPLWQDGSGKDPRRPTFQLSGWCSACVQSAFFSQMRVHEGFWQFVAEHGTSQGKLFALSRPGLPPNEREMSDKAWLIDRPGRRCAKNGPVYRRINGGATSTIFLTTPFHLSTSILV